MNSEEVGVTKPQPQNPIRQRMRIVFARGDNVRYVGHLDMVRSWERILRRAELPVAFTQGFNPRPRLAFASALPVGCTSDYEVLDVILGEMLGSDDVHHALDQAVPNGISIVEVSEQPYKSPALQTQLTASDFFVAVADESSEQLQSRVQSILDAEHIERQRRRKTYDLRPLILDMWVETGEGSEGIQLGIGMKLAAGQAGTGRPDEVVLALGLKINSAKIHRRKLIFQE